MSHADLERRISKLEQTQEQILTTEKQILETLNQGKGAAMLLLKGAGFLAAMATVFGVFWSILSSSGGGE